MQHEKPTTGTVIGLYGTAQHLIEQANAREGYEPDAEQLKELQKKLKWGGGTSWETLILRQVVPTM